MEIWQLVGTKQWMKREIKGEQVSAHLLEVLGELARMKGEETVWLVFDKKETTAYEEAGKLFFGTNSAERLLQAAVDAFRRTWVGPVSVTTVWDDPSLPIGNVPPEQLHFAIRLG